MGKSEKELQEIEEKLNTQAKELESQKKELETREENFEENVTKVKADFEEHIAQEEAKLKTAGKTVTRKVKGTPGVYKTNTEF